MVAQEDAVNKKVRSEFKQKVSALQRRIEDLTPKKIDDRAVARAAGGARRRPSSAGADRPSGAASKAAQIAGGSMKQAEAKAKRQAPNQASSVPANSWQGGKHKAKYTPSAASQEARHPGRLDGRCQRYGVPPDHRKRAVSVHPFLRCDDCWRNRLGQIYRLPSGDFSRR